MKKIILIVFIVFTALVFMGQESRNNYEHLGVTKKVDIQPIITEKKALGLALGGGGVRGFMHLGVIKALQENNIKVDLVTGSSAGSIVATLYASGLPYSDLELVAHKISPSELADFVISEKGFINGQKIANLINSAIPQSDLSQMPIPIGITATDLTAGESVLIQSGNPGQAAQTSSTIPGAFVPVEHDHHVLVDGGVLNVVPVYYAKDMGADVVVAVDIYCGNQHSPELSAGRVALSTFRLLSCKLSEEEINSADIVIHPDFEPDNPGDFDSRDEAIQAGYEATLKIIPKLKELLGESI